MHFILLPIMNVIIVSLLLISFAISIKRDKLSFSVIISRLFFVMGCLIFIDATYEGVITNTIVEIGAIYFEFGLITLLISSIVAAVRQNKKLTESK